jgi:hypothetical protein
MQEIFDFKKQAKMYEPAGEQNIDREVKKKKVKKKIITDV